MTRTKAVLERDQNGRMVSDAAPVTEMAPYTVAQGRRAAGQSLVYQTPSFTNDDRIFRDLIAYAPGLATSDADVQAVLAAEAAPDLADAPGHVDPAARELIERARQPHWQTQTISGEKGDPALR